MEHEGVYHPDQPQRTTSLSSLKNGHTPPPFSPDSTLTITLSQEDVELLRRVLNIVDSPASPTVLEPVPLATPEPPRRHPGRPTKAAMHLRRQNQEDWTKPPEGSHPRARKPGALVFLQGTHQDIKAATPIRERLWTGTVRWLAVQSTLGHSRTEVSTMRQQLVNDVNQHPDAKWWIQHPNI